jgi:hypothetical protein
VLTGHIGESLPLRHVESLVAGPQPGSFTFPSRAVPDVVSAAVAIGGELRDRPGGQGVDVDPAWPPGAGGNRAVWAVIARYFELAGAFRADPEAFAQVWNEFLDYSARETIPCVLTAPLLGFSADFETLRVSEGVTIEKMPLEWRQLRWEASSGVGATEFTTHGWGEWSYLIRCAVDVPKMLGAAPNQAREVAQLVVAALRLLAPGAVAILQSWLDPLIPVFGFPRSMGLGQLLGLVRLGPSMAWQGSEVELRQVFNALPRAASMPTVALALRRFDAAYGRISDEDRLIDYWIALEALFLPDRQDELSYMGSLRIARFLEQDRLARTATFELMRRSYRLRSQIVHGSTPGEIHEVAGETEQVLRRALRRMLLSGVAPSEAAFRGLLLD